MTLEDYVIEKIEEEQQAEILRKALRSTCKDNYDLLLLLLVLNGCKTRYISEVFDISRQAIQYRVRRFMTLANSYNQALSQRG